LANSLPHWVVSSAECVMTSSLTRFATPEEAVARVRDGGRNFRGEQNPTRQYASWQTRQLCRVGRHRERAHASSRQS